ncbi:MAG: hypothetical protein JWN56_1716 [Sphingobacteriales bacterium]|nr:hypothetical protein [Sphingobacteriales bacterium]
MIESTTFTFLKNLSENNNRDWFNSNKEEHDKARTNVLDFVSDLIVELSAIDKEVPENLNAKECVMRIYRDIRFSLDKTPYKTNFGIGISPFGKNFKGPGYYLHIEPGRSFVAGGSWFPEVNELKAIRQEIDYNYSQIEEIIDNDLFRKYFQELDREGALKTAPKGYPSDHPNINLLKLKSFTASHQLTNQELTKPDAAKKVAEGFANLYPLIKFLRNAII